RPTSSPVFPSTTLFRSLSHDFLAALEESGAATRKTGWLGQHLVLDGADGRPAAILPAYLKSHSMGEYVFDHGWADAFERAGGRRSEEHTSELQSRENLV